MPHYFLTVYLPDDFDPSKVDEAAMMRDMEALNREMQAAGVVEKFAGGLSPVTKSVRVQPNGEVIVTDGPYAEAKEHICGISILEVANFEEAVKRARKGAAA